MGKVESMGHRLGDSFLRGDASAHSLSDSVCSMEDLILAMKRACPASVHAQLDDIMDRYKRNEISRQHMQLELRLVAGREPLRQGLLYLFPDIDLLQQAVIASLNPQSGGASDTSSGSALAVGDGADGAYQLATPLP